MSSQVEHILVLEDNPTHRNVVAFNLTKAGYQVATAAQSAEALLLAREQQFDLVVTDYYLPDYPGTDFIKLLRRIDGYERTPFIMLTGRVEELNVDRLRDELLVLVLAKPCAMAKLVETVSKCLAIAHCTS